MHCLHFTRILRLFSGFALLLCLPIPFAFAQAKTSTGFYYPTGTGNPPTPGGTWLATSCDTYDLGDGIRRYHLGYDLLQPSGLPVYATADGTIVNITNTGDPDVTFIWIRHTAVDSSNGNTFNFWAIYGHTTIKPGLSETSPNNVVHGGDIIGYTMPYPKSVPHCHFAVNLSGFFVNVTSPTISYLNSAGQNATAVVSVGWGRGAYLPNGWCTYKSQNLALLQSPPAPGLRGFVDPLNFIRTSRTAGSGSSTNIYVSVTGNDTSSGSSGSPFRTVAHAIDQASSTQAVTINIAPGTYGEKIGTGKHIHFVTWGNGTVRIGG